MSPPRGLLPLLLCLSLAAPAAAQILPQSPRDLQRSAARSLLPASAQLRPANEAAPLTGAPPIRVRVWASRDYRDQTLHWKERVRGLLSRASRLTRAWPGVEFEVVEADGWEIDSAQRPLVDLLHALAAHDPGEDVDLVVGLGSALQLLPESIDSLGYAHTPGKHLVLRSLHSLAEQALLRQHLDQLDEAEREQVLSARAAHREVVIFLHEWAHTLGALHAFRATLVMSPLYDQGQSAFDDGNARLMLAALRARPRGPAAQRAALRAALAATTDATWQESDRAWLLASLAEPARAPLAKDAPPADPAGAEALAGCLAARTMAVGPARRAAIARHCPAAARDSEPWPALLLAEHNLEAGRDPIAVLCLDDAEAALGRRPDPRAFAALAELRRRTRAPSQALAAARRADAATAASFEQWHGALRRRLGLPADSEARGLAPPQERDYILSLEATEAAIKQDRLRVATRLIEQLDSAFPSLPAAPLLRCGLHLRQGHLPAAQAACQLALQREAESAPAHLLSAMVAWRLGRCQDVRAHADEALRLDPTLAETLGRLRVRCR